MTTGQHNSSNASTIPTTQQAPHIRKMYKILALFACIAIVSVHCAPEDYAASKERPVVEIIKSEISKNEDGTYQLELETGDGTTRDEKSSLINAGTDEQSLEVKGSYKYINEDGQEVEVFYTAGVNGFVPYGSIINPEISAVAEAAKDLPKQENEYELKLKSKTN